MKQIMILILPIFVSSNLFAQEKSLKNGTDKIFKIDVHKKLIPDYKIVEGWKDKYLSQNSIGLPKLNTTQRNNIFVIEPSISNKYGMPVLIPEATSSMPVMEPDTTIKYKILIKGENENLAFNGK